MKKGRPPTRPRGAPGSRDPEPPAEFVAEAVTLACGHEETRRLTRINLPFLEPLGVSVVYFQTERPVTDERRIYLNGGGSGPGHHAVFLLSLITISEPTRPY